MPRDIPVGNGSLFVSFDKNYILRELNFPHVGEENHTRGEPFRFGVWANGKFRWLPEGWDIKRDYLGNTLVTNVELANPSLNLRIYSNDCVDFHENIYLRKMVVENLSDEEKDVRLFFSHDFHIYGNEIGDTAAHRPEFNAILHYKGERHFLINAFANNKYGVDEFATGNKETETSKGTWMDAEDGHLEGNPIAQGSVDSTIAIHLLIKPKEKETCYYWISAGKNWAEVTALEEKIRKRGPECFLHRTKDYWTLWAHKENLNYNLLPEKVANLYKKSLLICRTQINNSGSIIAASDSDVLHFNRDTYSYMWPRDGALTANALDMADYEFTNYFYTFCQKIIEKEGYFLHKYTPSGSLGSSWHAWEKDNKPQLPIQEDETALVIWALWIHFQKFKDVEFIKPLYRYLIKRAADFMMNYRGLETGLPLPSYDLWEERQGILTFTVGTVYGGLVAAANFAKIFGEIDLANEYQEGAASMRRGMDKYLWLEEEKRFARMINFNKDGSIEIDKTIDASVYAIFAFGAYPVRDEKVESTMNQVYEKLWCKTETEGLARYENDPYYRVSDEVPGNPWVVTTLWLAQYYIALAKTVKELEKPMKLLEWAADHALPSGVLAEQLNPFTHEAISVSPLTWSHATFIATVQHYLDKYTHIDLCPTCGHTVHPKMLKQ
jgi:GH15 family glucan-1,4-alpha-glucosidase